ncbi:MAG: ATP-binding cassette domain-containing protein [Gammaproteobacteria bacterium]|nr:ATP-binding cassette domain-containing protein [Gammaproteobacteria bacterium]MBU1624018.1 ATP-binding cassette domain-containing protein [Gammaproteobacteria bacterium]MBU1981746.1 ATP-binding cassette domain-containing protein [Gammaproteobacteria bacterium]
MSSVISVENLSKKYIIGHQRPERYTALRDVLANGAKRAFGKLLHPNTGLDIAEQEEFWALSDISFEIKQGDRVGIIGRNGAGKSTLLKILSRITEPTSGRVAIKGRVASLLEVGTGFHPELTGRENIFLNGAILGMSKAEIRRKFDEIVSFAEVERFLDTPVKRYSSGMYVRLAFAVAAHLEPEILIVDEVLAVGDSAFQKKCTGKMDSISGEGRTVIFVSHNLVSVAMLCNRAILLERGTIVAEGRSEDVIDRYQFDSQEKLDVQGAQFNFKQDISTPAQISAIRIKKPDGKLAQVFDVSTEGIIEVDFILKQDFPTFLLSLHIWTANNALALASVDSDYMNYLNPTDMQGTFPRKAGTYTATIKIPAPLLNSGTYELEIFLTTGPARIDTQRGIFMEIRDNGSFLSFVSKAHRGGTLAVPLQWDIVGGPDGV